METVPENAEQEQQVLETAHLVFKRSPIHGTGGFARQFIPKEAQVIEYVGERIDKRESLRRCEADNPYIFTLNQETDLDGSVAWNPARFINHSCAPNCEAEVIGDRIWILAHRDIEPGEEITFNYGFDLEDYKHYPCRCGAANCVGFIVAEEYFEHVRRQRALAQESAFPGLPERNSC
jgi:SET domain-containing protein